MLRLRSTIRTGVVSASLWMLAASPLGPQNLPASPKQQTMLFVGDVMLSRGVGRKIQAEGDWNYPFLKIADTLRAADLNFGNLECPVSDVGRDLHHRYSFRADPKVIEGLKYAGFRVMSLANNHMDDWDRPALLDTVRRLRAAGILPVGAGANDLEVHYPVVIPLNGVKLAFLAYVAIPPEEASAEPDVPGVAWLDADRALADIRFARPLADLVIVSLHWGVEYASRPARTQQNLARQMIEAGADLIVGGHPHVVQPLEQYRGRWIAYSLGNFIFDQRAPGTHRGNMLKVTLRDKEIAGVEAVPISIEPSLQAVLTPPEELARATRRARRQPATPATPSQPAAATVESGPPPGGLPAAERPAKAGSGPQGGASRN